MVKMAILVETEKMASLALEGHKVFKESKVHLVQMELRVTQEKASFKIYFYTSPWDF